MKGSEGVNKRERLEREREIGDEVKGSEGVNKRERLERERDWRRSERE